MHPSYVDVENEFFEIGIEAQYLSVRLAHLDALNPPADPQEKWEATLICASAAEKIYTGCERVMARLAADLDGVAVTHAEGWHIALLRRMAHPYPAVRGAVISGECHAVLDKVRSFRHRERNTYGINLDFALVVERAFEAVTAFKMLHDEVIALLAGRNNRDGAAPAGPAVG
ncbi:hypothetical protein ACQW02_19540 [Humitalea sp. 24SJ18S-53]|uniref:ribonuclease toxin HepT-like protein n=1 Tax=Humitalea sp. 24SJ18S-53 TaxID=3422307 RepID=UPI003D677CC8